jgi:uncharacterized protein (TIGR02271 family)
MRTFANMVPTPVYPPFFSLVEHSMAKRRKSPNAAEAVRAEPEEADRTIESGEMVLRLLEEEFGVERRRVETGRVRVRKKTLERIVEVEETLERVEVDFERVPVDRIVEEMPRLSETEDTIIVPIVEEILVVERRLRLIEEVHIRKSRQTEQFRDRVKLRAQEVDVRRLPPRPNSARD